MLHSTEIPWRFLRTIEPIGSDLPVCNAARNAGVRRQSARSRRVRRADMARASFIKLVIAWGAALGALLAIALMSRLFG